MWEIEYTKRFLKELSKLPKDIQVQAERIVFDELLSANPFELGYIEHMRGVPTSTKSVSENTELVLE